MHNDCTKLGLQRSLLRTLKLLIVRRFQLLITLFKETYLCCIRAGSIFVLRTLRYIQIFNLGFVLNRNLFHITIRFW